MLAGITALRPRRKVFGPDPEKDKTLHLEMLYLRAGGKPHCCCCCCQVASVVSDSVRPHRRQPTRLPCPWDSPGRNTGMGRHFLLQCMKLKVKSLSRVGLLATPWTEACQAPPSMGFSRQEYWSGVPLPSPHQLPELTQTHVC